jgi:hypothetical protein
MEAHHSSQASRRWKLASIPLLAALLIYLLIPTADPGPAELASTAIETSVAESSATARCETAADQRAAAPQAPIPALSELLAANPFESLEAVERLSSTGASGNLPTSQPTAAAHEPPPEVKITAIYQSPSGPVAIVDNQLVRIGDFLSPQYRVIGIDHRGIELSTPQR